MKRIDMKAIFGNGKTILGMVHALPLPGAPRWEGSMDGVIERAVQDARALEDGGVDAIFVENYGDAPFFPGVVAAETIAALTVVVRDVARAVKIPIGVNVLRNNAAAALAIATATSARMIRVNVHTGLMNTDQGPIVGRAYETLRQRAALDARVAICADVLVKHATPPIGATYALTASDTWERGAADVLIVSGTATGAQTDLASLRETRAGAPHATIWIGSGLTPTNAARLLAEADGAIVGSAFERDGIAGNPVERDRVARLIDVIGKMH